MILAKRNKLQAYYANYLLQPSSPTRVEIFHNDDAILEMMGARIEFPKSSEKRFGMMIRTYKVLP